MNRVYKVIWSKAKHCYVVTSEIAKSHTKGESTGRGLKKLAAALLVAAALMGPNFAWAADTVTVKDTSGKEQTVYTQEGANGNFATKTELNAKANAVDVENTYAKTADVANTYVNKTKAEVTNLTASGNVSAGSFTNGAATMSNGSLNGINQINATGNIVTTSDMKAHDITAEVTIKGETINAVTGTFSGAVSAGSLNVTNKLEAGSIESTGSIEAKGNLKGDSLTVTNNASVGGQLTAGTLAAAGNNFTVGADGNVVAAGVNAGAGTIKTTGAVETGAFHATGNATVDGNTEIKGTLKAGATTVDSLDAGSGLIKTDGTVKAGDVQTGTLTTTGNVTIGGALTVTGKLNMDEIEMNKNGIVGDNNVTASTKVAAGEITSYKKATSTKAGGGEKESAIDYDENGTSTWAKATDADGKKNKSSLTVEGKGIKSIATDGTNNASTNLSNKGFNTFASDGGKNKTYTKQTAESLTSQIGDDGKVKSVMNGDGIANTATGKAITNDAATITNTATGNMTNTVGGKLLNDVTGDMENKVGRNLTTTVTGDVTEDYKANLSTTVGGSQTTTVTGDSSLKAENITNEAKNKITNKARDVETDATSSIVQKVTNAAGSNTSTQWSYQTKEEMSQTDGKTAFYLRGAAEEKSQLTDGDKKTTIDTVAGQTNTNITDGTNTSNDLQKADQIASSVTKGTNKTVVNQDAVSLASSITDGTKVNNTNNTVDKSEQLIKVDDTHFYAETRTAGSAVEALKSDGNTIISAKDAVTGTVSSAVTDGTNTTGSSMTAKGITNSAAESIVNEIGDGSAVKSEMTAHGITNTAKDGTITNDAKDLVNTASNSITDKVGENVERTMGTKKIEESVKDGTKSNTFTKTAKKDMNIITDGTNTSTLSQLADKVNTSLKKVDGAGNTTKSLNNVKTVSEDTTKMTDAASGEFSKRSQTVSQIQDKVGKTTVTTIDGKTTLTDEDHNHTTEMDYANVTKDLSVYRNTTLGQEGENTNLTVNSKSEFKDTVKMDKTLDVDGNTTLGKEGEYTTLTVNSESTFNKDVTMNENATVEKNLTVNRESTFNDKVTITKNGLAVTGGTTTDTLNVTGETRTGTLHVNGNGYVGGDLNVDGNIETHDAVLSADSRQVVTGRQLYQTNERVDRLDNRIKKVGANAAALAALRPGDFNPDDKFSIAAGFGSYRNANAAALGLFYRPNENVLLSLGTSFGDGENMVNAGVSVKFGRGKSMAERRKEMAEEVSSMRDEMRSQDERIAELEEMLKKQSELIEKLSKES
jgi:hypothetical protein